MSAVSTFEVKTAVVTGASGFIGSHLVDYLVSQGSIVHAVIRKTSDHRWLNKSDQVKIHIADLEQDQPLPFLEKADYLFHCAGLTKARTREGYFRGNAHASEVLYKNCMVSRNNFKAIVHLSSLAAAGPGKPGKGVQENLPCKPITYYGESKLKGEEIAVKHGSSLPVVVIRPPVVYGPRESNFFVYLKSLSNGWNLKIGKARKELSLIYVADLVRAMVQAALCFPKNKKIYYVTDGNTYSWEDVADLSMRILNVNARSLVIPESVLGVVANCVEALSWFSSKPSLIDRQRLIDIRQTSWVASPQSFFDSHGFQPKYNLAKGLYETIEWYKANNWL